MTPDRIGDEIDGVLEEELPSTDALSLGHPKAIDATFEQQTPGARVEPMELTPETVYAPDAKAPQWFQK